MAFILSFCSAPQNNPQFFISWSSQCTYSMVSSYNKHFLNSLCPTYFDERGDTRNMIKCTLYVWPLFSFKKEVVSYSVWWYILIYYLCECSKQILVSVLAEIISSPAYFIITYVISISAHSYHMLALPACESQ